MTVYALGPFRLDTRDGLLFQGREPVALGQRAIALLRALVERPGALVSKDALIEAAWPGVAVEDSNLTVQIAALRRALGETPDGDRWIETMPRRGYRFIGPVVASEENDVKAAPPVAAPREAIAHGEAERRQLTILSCELVGLAALSARLDPEELRAVTAKCHVHVAEIVAHHHGYISQYQSDGALAYFGYPEAHEHDAESAVHAALSLAGSPIQLDAVGGTELTLCVGIASGLVVVGDEACAGAAEGPTAVGEAPNIAGRLQGLAEPGQVVIAQSTRRLTAGMFEYRDLGKVPLKGIVEPVQAWQVVGASTVESRFEAQRGTELTPLAGREEELDLLLHRWRQAASGEGRVVLLSGEPGIGKSRLTVALQERVQAEPHTRLRYFCSPHHTDSAFYPVTAQLERAAGFARPDTPDAKLDKLVSLLDLPSSQDSDIQLLTELLSIPTGDRYAPLNWSPRRKREKTFEALLRELEMLSSQRPVFIIYEDVHWLDPSSCELLDVTVERVASLPVLLVVTFRPEFQPPWIDQPHVSTIILGRLGRREAWTLAGFVARDNILPDDVRAQVVERADGVPLFLEELTRAAVEAGAQGGDGRRTRAMAPPSALPVPAALQASLAARLDRLGPLAKEIAQVGAAIGREFSYELLAAVAQRRDHELQSALGRLINAGLVFCRGTPPQATFLFKHVLVRDAAYGCLLRSQRQTLHARIASVFEERFPEIVDQKPELLAQHWTEAGSIKHAIDNWIKAGRTSCIRCAMVEAIVQLRKGLALLPGLLEGPERWRQELELQTVLGWALSTSKGEGAPEAGEAIIRARNLCDHLGDRSSLGRVLFLQGSHYLSRAQYAAARHVAEELLPVARERNDAGLELQAHQLLARSLHWLGAFASAVDHFERALSVRVPETRDQSVDTARVSALSYLAYDLTILGHLDQAVARRDQALALARQTTRPYSLAIALTWAARVDAFRGAEQSALECDMELADIAKEQSFALFLAIANLDLARSLSTSGKTAEGLELARQGFAEYAATGFTSGQTLRLAALGYCCERAGEIDEAWELLLTALETAKTTEERYYEAELHRLKGEWLVAHHRQGHDEAEACYQRALAVARTQYAKLWELRAATSLARLWHDPGRSTEARDLLAPIYGWFTQGFDTPDLKATKALLDELASRVLTTSACGTKPRS